MPNIQEIFNQLKELQQEQKDIRAEYKDALKNADEYEEILEKIEELKQRKKEVESIVQSRMGQRYDRLEELKDEIAKLKQTLSDIAISDYLNGKNIEIKDENNNLYEPRFTVTFKKTSSKAL